MWNEPNSFIPHSKIRLVHCIGSLRLGGAEGQLAELITRLPAERFEQSLVLLRGEGPLIERVRAAGCPVLDLDLRRRRGALDPRTHAALAGGFVRLVRHLRDFRPHILHGWLDLANIFGAFAAKAAGVPRLVTSRRQLSDYKQGRPLQHSLENLIHRFTDAMVVNAEAVRRDVLEHDRIDPAKIQCIYNGVDAARFQGGDPAGPRREFALTPEDLVVLVLARLHPHKGHETLLRAAATLAPRHPRLRLVFAGADQGIGPALERLAGELGLGGRLLLAGVRRDIPDLLALADVVVLPSPQNEGFSNAVLEAMAAGRPVVATRLGGSPEAVREGVDGLLVPPRDAAALAGALEPLLADPDLRRRMGASARERVESEFSIPRAVTEYVAFYERLAARAGFPC